MKDNKFRAWDKEEKKMFEVVCVYYDGGCKRFPDSKYYNSHKIEIMQFTGLKDKNGKEIYEEDIVQLTGLDLNFVIVYYEDRFSLKDTRYLDGEFPTDSNLGLDVYRKRIEVIGNIYENPELLEEEK